MIFIIILMVGAAILASLYTSVQIRWKKTEKAFNKFAQHSAERRNKMINVFTSLIKTNFPQKAESLKHVDDLIDTAQDNVLSLDERIEAENTLHQTIQGTMDSIQQEDNPKDYPGLLEFLSRWHQAEEKVNQARKQFNQVARQYNNLLDTFPGNMLAQLFGFQKVDLLVFKDQQKFRTNQ